MEAFILTGLVLGSIYAISALGLVLTYTSSRVLNFAHGAIAYAAAVFYFWLNQEQGWSIPGAAIMTVFVMCPVLGLFLWAVMFRHLTHAPPEVRFVSTVGLWVALPALVKILFPFSKGEVYDARGILKNPTNFFDVLGVNVTDAQAAVLVAATVIAIVLTIVIRMTPLGLSMRASVDSPRTARISGINTSAITAGSWMVGTSLAGFAGVLLTPILGLSEIQFTFLLVASLAAAVVGRLTSLPLTFAGAMLIGLLQGISLDLLPDEGVLAKGFRPSLPFIVMLVALLAYQGLRREKFEVDLRAGPAEQEVPAPPRRTGWRAAVGPLLVALVLVSVPLWLDDFWIGVVSQGIALAVLFLTFTLVTGEGGMLSLCQATLAGVGAFGAALLATNAGWPVGLAVLAGACIAVPVGLLVAALSLRLGDIYLALATFAFALLIENLVFAREDFSNFDAGVTLLRPVFLGIDFNDRTNFYLLLIAIFCVVALLIVTLRRGTSGLVFASMRSSETAAATTGIGIVRTKLLLFGASAFCAGLGGALLAMTIGRATPNSFNVLIGIVWLAIVVTWGVRSVVGALLAGIIFAVVPQQLSLLLMLVLLFVAFGILGNLVVTRRIRHPIGMVVAIVVVVVAVIGTSQLINVEVPDSWVDVPTLLFGLGAVFLASEPRGALFNMINSIRLRGLQHETRRIEAAALEESAP
ncbi:MAG: ABC transporter permease [Acidimicrobiia bacterium]|nr:ABC transporter permease [Acidimicrobiia bacterium]